jgi:hypothetical protein
LVVADIILPYISVICLTYIKIACNRAKCKATRLLPVSLMSSKAVPMQIKLEDLKRNGLICTTDGVDSGGNDARSSFGTASGIFNRLHE